MSKRTKPDLFIIAAEDKARRVAGLIIANTKKARHAAGLVLANINNPKRAAQFIARSKERLMVKEKEKLVAELIIANKELLFQNEEKEKRAAELIIANKELLFQNEEKEKRAAELILAKEQAEEGDRLKSAFLANISHEIRTPMNGILGFASLLKSPQLSGEAQQKYIDMIEKSGTRMLNIITDIVNISKIESGTTEISVSETNVNEQIAFVYNLFKFDAARKSLSFAFNNTLPDEKSFINTDNEKLISILSNLVKNAIKYTDQGSVEFGYILKNNGIIKGQVNLEFYVKDTGIGIAKNKQEIIFERFIQADIADKMARQGAGLGLTISRAYVTMLGGRIWVESAEGEGSVFYFTIPYNYELKQNIIIKSNIH
jgi:signal transduction histidine kinase